MRLCIYRKNQSIRGRNVKRIGMVLKRINGVWSMESPDFAGQFPTAIVAGKPVDFSVVVDFFKYFTRERRVVTCEK